MFSSRFLSFPSLAMKFIYNQHEKSCSCSRSMRIMLDLQRENRGDFSKVFTQFSFHLSIQLNVFTFYYAASFSDVKPLRCCNLWQRLRRSIQIRFLPGKSDEGMNFCVTIANLSLTHTLSLMVRL